MIYLFICDVCLQMDVVRVQQYYTGVKKKSDVNQKSKMGNR